MMNVDLVSILIGAVAGGATVFIFGFRRKKKAASSTLSIEAIIHELKTPLTGLSWIFSSLDSLVLGSTVNSETLDLIKEAKKKVGDSLELANDALLALDTSSDYATYKFATADISEVIKKVIEENSFTAKEKYINVSFSKLNTVPPFPFDEIKMTLAIRNLVSNAVKYSGSHGSVDVTLSQDENDAVVSVEDKGIGIPESDIPKVANKFFRGSNTGDTAGSGLGLFIVKNIVSGHHGRLEIQSREGIGTKITIFIPTKWP